LLILLGSRLFAGICGANLGVAAAAIADVTTPDKRSRGMGLIGMAFGLGFVFGPVIGGIAFKRLGLSGPGLVASGLCLSNLVLAFFILPETRPSHPQPEQPRRARWDLIQRTLNRPVVGFLVTLYFVATLSFTCFESVLPLLLNDLFHFDEEHISYMFAYCGLMGALIQGAAIRPLVKHLGDENLVWISLFIAALSLLVMPFSGRLGLMLVALALFAGGSGLNRPPTMGLVSRHAPADEQGATMGIVQNAGTLARVFGPVLATSLYHWRTMAPFLFCAAMAGVAGVVAMGRLKRPRVTATPA
jgi:predicted MFS family arabinose efflux permease